MRLCLVSSILALIASMHVHSGWLLVAGLMVILVICCSWLFIYQVNAVSLAPILLFSLVISVSYAYSQYWLGSAMASRLPASHSGIIVEGRAEIVDCDYSQPKLEKYELKLLQLNSDPKLDSLALKRIRVVNYLAQEGGAQQPSCADTINFKAKLRAPYSFVNPANYDYEAWLLSKGIDASGYLISFQLVDRPDTFSSRLIKWRQEGILRAAKLPGLAGQVVPALLFGESGYLDKEYWSWLQLTGSVHLLVVSGLHIGFVVLMVLFLWRRIVQLEMILGANRSLLLKFTPLVLLLSCFLYAYLAGMGLAVQRSGLMLLFAIIVSFYRSHWSVLDTWLWVMWLILILDPLASLFVGFWFSFTAVGCLLLAYCGSIRPASESVTKFSSKQFSLSFVDNYLGRVRRFGCYLLGIMIKPQWVVFLGIMPLLWLFHQPHSMLSLMVNALAIPLLAFVILPLSIFLMLVPSDALIAGFNCILELGFGFLHWAAGFSSWLVYKPSGYWLITLLPLAIIACLLKGMPFRRLSLFLIFFVYFIPIADKAELNKVIVFDVGQGLSIYGKSSEGLHWLYDAGARFRSGFSIGESVVAKNLLSNSVTGLDLLFISHSDNDHAGGQAGLLRRVDVKKIIAGQPKPDEVNCHFLDSRWRQQTGLKWRVLSLDVQSDQQSLRRLKDNNLSCVVQIQVNNKRILIPGDIEKFIERKLVEQYGRALKSDVLIIPHHGSKTSSSLAFVKTVSPDFAIVSSGFKNPFKHPHSDVLAVYRELGVPVYNTAESGALELTFPDLTVIEWRKKSAPVWRQM